MLVHVHGSGYAIGTGTNFAANDSTNLVELSMKEDLDVIIVSFDYRLNLLGFLASDVRILNCFSKESSAFKHFDYNRI